MNYGCIVENEETSEVCNPSCLKYLNSQSPLLHADIMNIRIVFPGLALCGKAKHLCERHHKLWYIPL